ncbi:MAG: flagellar filament outer layer protein FlaA [Treponema sp.]|jgi:hypothetical protein|nr:flagellar filament outer layer protein FlaA [Treponema sp.]
MKRILVFAVAALVAVGSAFADEKVLIDFTKLTADADDGQNEATRMDLSNQAGRFGTPDQKAAAISSLAIEKWNVVLTSSAQSLENKRLSKTAEAPSAEYEKVMGVRIHFPLAAYNSSASIKPPFEIPGFDQEGDEATATPYAPASRFKPNDEGLEGKGIIYNVGSIKSVQANVYGLNFPHKLFIILINNLGEEKVIPMGTLNYEGWAKLTWNNPQYVQNVRDRDQRLYSIYPQSQTFVRFGGFIVQKDAADVGGDFIGYFQEVRVLYDQAVLETDTPRDINDEDVWNIIRDRETDSKDADMRRFGARAVQEYLDHQRQATETYDAHGKVEAAGE